MMTTDGALSAMDIDAHAAGRPVREPIDDNRRIASTFDTITYEKGGGVLAMVESYLGAEEFRKGVQRHLALHRYGVARSEDFFAALAQSANRTEVVAAFRSFVDQAGVPLVSVRRSADGARLQLAQQRYAPLGAATAGGSLWQIPFCATLYPPSQGAAQAAAPRKACTLLSGATGSLELPKGYEGAVVMPNAGGAGYYRFELTGSDYDSLLALAAKLPEREALVLADSVGAGFDAGRIGFEQLLSAAAALADHPQRSASTRLGDALATLGGQMLSPTQREALRKRLGEIYRPRLESLGYDLRAGAYAQDPPARKLLRRTLLYIVAQGARDPAVRKALTEATLATLDHPEALDPALRDRAWTAAVQEAGARVIPALEKLVSSSADPQVRSNAARALGRVEDEALSRRVRQFALGDQLHATDVFGIVFGQFSAPETRAAALAWLIENDQALFHKLPGFSQPVLFGAPELFCDAESRLRIEQGLAPKVKSLGMGELELTRALESVDLCIAQKRAHAAQFSALLGD
jgi:aminopeptidase N